MTLKKMNDKQSGFTLTEIMLAIVIIAIISVPLTLFLSNSLKNVTTSTVKLEAQEKARQAMAFIEPLLMESNELYDTVTSSVAFVCDSNRMPGYNPTADFDGDGIINIMDPDIDNDAGQIMTLAAANQWRAGYNLKDNDDDNDNNVDVQYKIYRQGLTLMLAYSINNGVWTARPVAQDITTLTFTYFGSKREALGAAVDLGNDGMTGTADAGENDGLISPREIDWVQAPTGHGNRSGAIDTPDERRYIVTIYIEIGADSNRDGVEDYRLRTEISPPLLVLKRAG